MWSRRDPCDEGYQTIQDMRLLQSLGQHLIVASERSARDPQDVLRLQRMGVEVAGAPIVGGLAVLLEFRGPELNVVYLHGLETTDRLLSLVRKLAPGATVVLRAASGRAVVGKAGGPGSHGVQQVDVLLSELEPDGGDAVPDARSFWRHVAGSPTVVDVAESISSTGRTARCRLRGLCRGRDGSTRRGIPLR